MVRIKDHTVRLRKRRNCVMVKARKSTHLIAQKLVRSFTTSGSQSPQTDPCFAKSDSIEDNRQIAVSHETFATGFHAGSTRLLCVNSMRSDIR